MPESSRWVIRPAAVTDLSEIWRYGASNWGIGQADRYADSLFALFDLLADFPEMARERRECQECWERGECRWERGEWSSGRSICDPAL